MCHAIAPAPEPVPPKRVAHYLWVVLIAPTRGPPLWESCDALAGEGSQIVSDWDLAAQPTPDYEVDQRVSW